MIAARTGMMKRSFSAKLASVAVALAALASFPAHATTTQAAAKPTVIYTGPVEKRGSLRAKYQQLMLNIAHIWADCDADIMRRTLTADVDFSYPGRRLIGIDAALADLDGFCKVATDRSIYFPKDAFYIDTRNGRIAAEVQFRVTQNGEKQVVNDVWIATVRDGRISVI